MIELLIIFTHLLIDPGKGRWPLCVWWPWLQEAQRACGSYGKRRVCQRATACLQEEAATGVLPQCQIPFPAWENAFSESPIMTPQSYPELWGSDHSERTLGGKTRGGLWIIYLVQLLEEEDGFFSFPHPNDPPFCRSHSYCFCGKLSLCRPGSMAGIYLASDKGFGK